MKSVKCFLINSRITICGVSYKLGISVVIVQNVLQDNLNMHEIANTAMHLTVHEFLKENKITVISHTFSAYSSDVALNGFSLFPELKLILKEGC
jgi:hypothetical protein